MSDTVIELKNVSKTFRLDSIQVDALKNLSLTIKKGELTAIVGPSGSGKSTLMYIMGCLDTPTEGKVIFEGEDVSGLSEERLAHIRNQKIGFVFQMYNLLPRTSAMANVLLPVLYSEISEEEGKRRAQELLQNMGLADRWNHTPSQLSGGEQQRVAIARALINQPSLVLADEPTGNVDSKTGEEILILLKEVNQKGNTVVIVTHDITVAKKCHRVIKIKDGQIL
jgi:putative ABC transport system ATP-binding protein